MKILQDMIAQNYWFIVKEIALTIQVMIIFLVK